MLASHGILSPPAIERIENSKFTRVIVTNTISPKKEVQNCNKIDICRCIMVMCRGYTSTRKRREFERTLSK